MGGADDRARDLIEQFETGARPGAGHLGALERVAEDQDVKRWLRCRAVALIATIDTEAGAAVAARLIEADWTDGVTRDDVVQALVARGEVGAALPAIAAGHLSDSAHQRVLRDVGGLPPASLVRAVAPYLSDPGGFDPSALLDLMRVLATSGEEGAEVVRSLATYPDSGPRVRTEAAHALERERLDRPAGEMSAETVTFQASRFSASWFEQRLSAFAAERGLPYEATIGSGLVMREITVTVTARPADMAALVDYAGQLAGTGGGGAGPPVRRVEGSGPG